MNSNSLKDQWTTLKPKLKAKWPKLSDQDLNTTSPSCDWLVNKLKERQGVSAEDAKRQVDQFCTENNIAKDNASSKDSAASIGSGSSSTGGPGATSQTSGSRTSKSGEQQSERDDAGRTQAAE